MPAASYDNMPFLRNICSHSGKQCRHIGKHCPYTDTLFDNYPESLPELEEVSTTIQGVSSGQEG